MSIFDDTKFVPVYFQAGNFGDSNKPKFTDAPFLVAKILGELYVMPKAEFSTNTTDAFVQNQDNGDFASFTDMGFFNGESIFLDGDHVMGDTSDNWYGLHAVSFF